MSWLTIVCLIPSAILLVLGVFNLARMLTLIYLDHCDFRRRQNAYLAQAIERSKLEMERSHWVQYAESRDRPLS